MASDNKDKKQTVLVIVQNLPQDIMMGQVNMKSTSGTTAETEKVKEHSQCQPKVQGTELVKQSKEKIEHTESSKQSSQSESVCDKPENEQDNADLKATTKGDKFPHLTTQSTNFVVKVRCKYCDKSFNNITNHRKHFKVCAEAANDCKIRDRDIYKCKTVSKSQVIMYHEKSQLYDMSQDN